jgi:hypothetical protein
MIRAGRSEMRHVHFLTSRVPLRTRIAIVMHRAGNDQDDVERGIGGESGMFSFCLKC